MNTEDLKTLARVGRALWADPRESEVATVETLSAVSLLDLTPERALERAATALLERVSHQRPVISSRSARGIGTLALNQAFFRLSPEERLLLVGLHQGRWSYGRLSRIFRKPIEQIEEMAWSARVALSTALVEVAAAYPAGARSQGPHCPEYDPRRPWTQRFLDEEIHSGRDRLFLQNHLMACESCREALKRCRDLFYALEPHLPWARSAGGPAGHWDEDQSRVLETMTRISRASQAIWAPTERTFGETLAIFIQRRNVRWVLGGMGALLAWEIVRVVLPRI